MENNVFFIVGTLYFFSSKSESFPQKKTYIFTLNLLYSYHKGNLMKHIFKTLSLISLSICAMATPIMANSTTSNNAYTAWHNSTLIPVNQISSKKIKNYYKKTQLKNPHEIGRSWIHAMGKVAAQDPNFRAEIIEKAAQFNTPLEFALFLGKNYRTISGMDTSHSAFKRVLEDVAKKDAYYKVKAEQFKAAALGKRLPDDIITYNKNMYFSLSTYMDISQSTPSIMERILLLGAFDILNVSNAPKIREKIASLTDNYALNGCFKTAQLNSNQCRAAAYHKTDLMHCMAKHNLTEVSSCTSWLLP